MIDGAILKTNDSSLLTYRTTPVCTIDTNNYLSNNFPYPLHSNLKIDKKYKLVTLEFLKLAGGSIGGMTGVCPRPGECGDFGGNVVITGEGGMVTTT